ncbi:chitooligosaccharidolytic beta-N-acetylglucosaminidase [Bacillus rossius redtenbacheri]|uniref:chitooligosaccharidolytic beta-N-acetylglucosaminidase n=1 Tax=Bacillus rossius redtenbacheri TaxID=93214 RepID=UPI002FDE276E
MGLCCPAVLVAALLIAHCTAEEVLVMQVGKQEASTPAVSPVWTWECQSQRCEKLLLAGGQAAQSLDACKLLCGEYRVLWPRPTGKLSLGDSLYTISPNSITAELTPTGRQLSPEVGELFRNAVKLFRKNVLDLATGSGPIRSVGRSLLVECSIDDTALASFKSDTDESYLLQISEASNGRVNASITAPTFFGLRHGLETLLQLVIYDDVAQELRVLSSALIEDRPVFPHRGILLDTARNFISVESIKRTLEGMAASKLNTFHWHLTDSHSFPFQSQSYPQLSQYGAYSPRKVYTPDDVRSVVEHARVRGVRVVPELDAPAHVGEGWQWAGADATVCVKAEPWRSYCVEPPCGQLNPTSDRVYEILAGVYKDMFALFDSDIFHMGGDEVNFNCWNSSEQIVSWMRSRQLSRDEPGFLELWDHFQTRALAALAEANGGEAPPVVLWTSGLTGKGHVERYLSPDKYIIQIWTTGADPLIGELVNKGYRVILSNYDALYFDCGFGAWVGEGNNWCSPYIGWQKVYGNSPYGIVEKLGANATAARRLVLGSEATLWTEQVDDESVDGRLWPRSSAMAERLWSDPSEGWRDAEPRLLHHRERLVRRGVRAEALEPLWCHQNHGYCYL